MGTMPGGHIALLIIGVAIGPFIWGSVVYWLVAKLWPEGRHGSRKLRARPDSPPPLDYQI
jgi:hypothetical protein